MPIQRCTGGACAASNTRLVIELADLRGHPARVIARRHKAMLEEHMAEVLARANGAAPRERAREIWLLSEGAISLMLVHGDRRYAAAAAEAAKRLIQTDQSGRRPTRRTVQFGRPKRSH
jgi:hypothetical protein